MRHVIRANRIALHSYRVPADVVQPVEEVDPLRVEPHPVVQHAAQVTGGQARPEDQAPELNSVLHEEGITDFFERQREQRPTLDPERTFIGKEIKARIATAMERLSPRERIVFEMKHYQGLKLRAIGDALGTTEETVKNSLFRATRKLRLELGGLR